MVKCTGRGLVVKRPGVLSKVQVLTLVLGVGVFFLLAREKVLQVFLAHRFFFSGPIIGPHHPVCAR